MPLDSTGHPIRRFLCLRCSSMKQHQTKEDVGAKWAPGGVWGSHPGTLHEGTLKEILNPRNHTAPSQSFASNFKITLAPKRSYGMPPSLRWKIIGGRPIWRITCDDGGPAADSRMCCLDYRIFHHARTKIYIFFVITTFSSRGLIAVTAKKTPSWMEHL